MKTTILLLLLTIPCLAHSIPLTLKNRSIRSIYLEIPGIMNPNLSPLSNSGVDLSPDQEVYFFHKQQRILLFRVEEIKKPSNVKVNRLIRKKIKELRSKP
jgi:hypothetical protein